MFALLHKDGIIWKRMTEKTFKKLELEQIAMLDAIIFLRSSIEDNEFILDSKKVHDYLSKTDKYGGKLFTPNKQREIIMKLVSDHIITAEAHGLTSLITNMYTNPFESPLTNIFIYMTKDEANELNSLYIANHIVYLKLDNNKCCLCVSIDKKNDWKDLHALDEGSVPYKILHCAQKHINKEISFDRIREEETIDEDFKGEYMSAIFQRTKSVKALHPKLIECRGKSITFRRWARYTYNELCDLKTELKI